MVIPYAEVGAVAEAPAWAGRALLSGELGGGVLAGRIDVRAHATVGGATPTPSDWSIPLGFGWQGTAGVDGGLRIPVGAVALRPALAASAVYLLQADYERDRSVGRLGARLGGGLDLVAPAGHGWLAVGVHAGWSTLDAGLVAGVGLRVGARLGR